jgi:lipopolysaccharide/colanic/teichoic acid biosynthesis glycosyltransferase
MIYRRYIKRLVDLIGSVGALIIMAPLFLLISVLLIVQNRGRIFFYQIRIGYREKPFEIMKFKTMTDRKDSNGQLLPDRERITRLGKWIRSLSLDEIPQLINVIKGDMSLVGPRPLLPKYLPLYSETQRMRHQVKPGITGWAQINGRNAISWTKKFEYDLFYVQQISFSLDMKILWITVQKVITREGINQSQARPMQPFDGKN